MDNYVFMHVRFVFVWHVRLFLLFREQEDLDAEISRSLADAEARASNSSSQMPGSSSLAFPVRPCTIHHLVDRSVVFHVGIVFLAEAACNAFCPSMYWVSFLLKIAMRADF